MRVIFFTDHITVRGTTDALFAYAHYNETILGNQSVVVMETTNVSKSDFIAFNYFSSLMPITLFNSPNVLQKICSEADVIYYIKYGRRPLEELENSSAIRTVIHCVFDMEEPHGDVYAGVAETLARKFGSNLFVPHMITLRPSETKENRRQELNIPVDAKVFGRYGGDDTFNLPFVMLAMAEIVKVNSLIYFVFINTPKFVDHHQIIFLDKIITPDDKNRFICTCDAHIEASTLGHTFGLAMGEFAVNNKPIIAYRPDENETPLWNTAHFDILGDRAFYFKNAVQFNEIIELFAANFVDLNADYNSYRE
jgi:hypothetical protein